MRLYWEVAKRAYQRQLAYRTANLNGLLTNACFGYLRAVVFVAIYQGRNSLAGYDARAAITYSWATQALIMVVALWGWWEIEETIRSGDIVSDLAKPFSYLGFWLARDYGRALYFMIFRCIPIFLVGLVTFGVRWPSAPVTWLATVISVILAIAVCFAIRFMINVSAFWTADARGLGGLATGVMLVLSGFVMPLAYFPAGLRTVLQALPFASIVQIPCDIFLERLTGLDLLLALAQQAVWAVILMGAAQLLLIVATRRVVVQGG